MKGTEKQIAYAEDLRKATIFNIKRQYLPDALTAASVCALESMDNASDIINLILYGYLSTKLDSVVIRAEDNKEISGGEDALTKAALLEAFSSSRAGSRPTRSSRFLHEVARNLNGGKEPDFSAYVGEDGNYHIGLK